MPTPGARPAFGRSPVLAVIGGMAEGNEML